MNCHRCKKAPVAKRSTSRCEKCLADAAAYQAKKIATPEGRAKRNEAVRAAKGHKPWQPGGKGRVPFGVEYIKPPAAALRAKRRKYASWVPGARGAAPLEFRDVPGLKEIRIEIHKSQSRLRYLKKKNYGTAFEELRLATFVAQRNVILTSA